MNNWTFYKHFACSPSICTGFIIFLLFLIHCQSDVNAAAGAEIEHSNSEHRHKHNYESLSSAVKEFQEKHANKFAQKWKLAGNVVKTCNAFAKQTSFKSRYVQKLVKLNDYFIPKMISGLVQRDSKTGALHSPDSVISTMLRFMNTFLLKRQRAHYEAIRQLTLPDCGCIVGISLDKAEVFDKAIFCLQFNYYESILTVRNSAFVNKGNRCVVETVEIKSAIESAR